MASSATVARGTPGGSVRSLLRRFCGRHPVIVFLVKRVIAGAATLLVASFVIFCALNVLPGNVATAVLGRSATPANTAALSARLGLDRPLLDRYVSWLGDAMEGDFGQSAVALAEAGVGQGVGGDLNVHNASVASDLRTPLLNSLVLAVVAVMIIVPAALLLGIVAGAAAGRPPDYAVSYSALVIGAFPEFVLGTFVILLFFNVLHILPPVATLPPGQGPLSHPTVLVLPVLTLFGVAIGFGARQIRAGMVESLRQDYVTVARLHGIGERRILTRYALRNALAPSVQVFAQIIQYLVGGIIIVESVFAYPGIGTFLVNAVQVRDVPEVAAVALILAAIYIGVNIVADLLVVILVPKLRRGASRA